MYGKLKRRVIRWLRAELAAEGLRVLNESNCVLAKETHLLEEARIENFSGESRKVRIGNNTYVRGRLLTYGHGGEIQIGSWSYVGLRTEIWSMDRIQIGDRVLISHDVNIHDGTAHSMSHEERHDHFKRIVERGHPRDPAELLGVKSAPIIIEDDVWINLGVTILRGVRIGKGSVIAAGSIVTKDIPPGVLYRCKVVPEIVAL